MSLNKLKNLKEDDLERFTLEGLEVKAKVLSVHDGDTLDLAFYRNEELVRFNCRLEDINSPEIHEPTGKLVRDFLAWICMGHDPGQFDVTAKIWSKQELQHELNKSKNLVFAVFGDLNDEKYGRSPVTLENARTGESINKMVQDFAHNLHALEMAYEMQMMVALYNEYIYI